MYRIGIDLGGTIIKIGLVKEGSVLAFTTIPASSQKGLVNSLPNVKKAIEELLQAQGLDNGSVKGIGLAFPGLVDPVRKKVLSTNHKYDDAPGLDLEAWFRSSWDAAFCLDNDARLATLGEWQYGAAKGHDNLVMVTIGTGIGTGVIIEGKLLYGLHFQAGSLGGHFTIDYNGRKCSCGNSGCVEAMASSAFLPAIIHDHPRVSDGFKSLADAMDFRKLFQLSSEGNADAILVRDQCLDVWSAALVTYIHAYDPSIIVLAGGILNSSAIILPHLKRKVKQLAWCPNHEVELVTAQTGDHAALLGIEYVLSK
ncbi:MAG: ROK family protein [Chitinophagaceae bacterium]